MRSGSGIIWLACINGLAPIVVRDRAAVARYAGAGFTIEGPYVPGRKPNPLSPRAIRDRLNGFHKD